MVLRSPHLYSTEGTLPRVDDNFIQEGSRVEVLAGRLLMSPPADEYHATLHQTLAYLLGAHVAPGWQVAVDMLTRTGHRSNFAPDASIYPVARDPSTDGRFLEELAFEIADSQPLSSAGKKARELISRGVRRVFCLVVKQRKVLEWSAEKDGWSPLGPGAVIDDRCFVRPLPLRALVDAAARDGAVVAALKARQSPAIEALEAEAHERGRAEERVHLLLGLLAARQLRPSPEEERFIRQADETRQRQWFMGAAAATSVGALLGMGEG